MPRAAKLSPNALAAREPVTEPISPPRAAAKSNAGAEQVRVLARGLAILRAFTPRNGWLSNHEIATITALPRPTVSRLTTNLTGLGYLNYSTELRKYSLGLPVLALGFSALAKMDIRVLARPLLQRLADQEAAPVVLASRDGMAMVATEVCHCNKSIFSLRINVGSRLVFPSSAVGLAILGAMAPAEREEALREISIRFKKQWPELQKLISGAVEQYRRYGFCTSFGTSEEGINGVATAIDTPNASQGFAIGIAGPSYSFPMERLQSDLGPKLLAVRRDLMARLDDLAPNLSEP